MARRSAAVAALCGAGVGLGLWSTAASLDHAAGTDGPFRVAMLPAPVTLFLLMGVAGLALVAIVALAARAGGPAASDRTLDVLKPLAAAGLLVLPYLPWLPEQMPAVLLLSGPGAWIWWGVLTAGVVFARATQHVPGAPGGPAPDHASWSAPLATATRRRWTTGILLLSLAASGLLADRFMRSALFPGGDEPHYLIIAQSLWRDGDLRIENNHVRRDYDEYFPRDLAPHYLTRGVDGEIYSIHPVGMPVLIAPIYAAGGYATTVWAFLLMGAAALTLTWRLAWAVTGSAGAATFAWVVLAFGVPWVFNTFSIYPEIPAALAVTTAFTLTAGWRAGTGRHHGSPPPVRFLAAGLALATLPWLSTKYAGMALALGLVLLGRVWWPWPQGAPPRRRALLSTAAVAVPCIVSLAGWFSFFQIVWGTFSPAAPYGIQRETRLEYLLQGAPGLLFDQEYGVLLFAPALVLVIPGLFVLWRQGGARRRLGLEIMAVWAGLLCIVGAFHIWWGGSAIVGRPVVSALPLLVVPVAAQWMAGAAQPWRRAAHVVLLATGIGLTILLAAAQNGLLLGAGRDGSSQVLEYIAPSSSLWTLWPTFLRQPPATAAAMTFAWLGPILFTGWILGRMPVHAGTRAGQALLGSSLILVASLAISSALVQATFEPSTPPADLSRRQRARLLDEFDDLRRPLVLRYAPLGRLDPANVPGLFPLVVNQAGQRTSDPGTRLFGQRLSLPAGRYGVDLVFAGATPGAIDGTLDVRVGRTGPPFQRWPVAVTPPGSWGRAFSLPVDAGFVGFEASASVAGAGPQLRLTPQQVVPVSRRPAVPAVLGSGRYGDILLFVHGDDAWPEPDGLWVRGRSTAAITIASATPRPLTVSVRAGARPVEVEVRIGSTTQHAALTAGQTTTLSFPAAFDMQLMQISTSDGFVPAEVEPGSRDHRLLGCWIEVR